ncbi:hypothetical protein TL16_g11525 [Triparma laevis f. inornata]|uniref:Uncharacterized protein n=1 Tax=Triparma laevis f. inornata TaxID=1714386 RepID=A0A9W7BNX8_9STRA|nr:hypothetical protein TL16_g11525 [Triparma laevis f. inornata]
MEALVVYSLTNNKGGTVNDFLSGLIVIMIVNAITLITIALYEYTIKPAICKPSTRAAASFVTPTDSFHVQDSGLSINVL